MKSATTRRRGLLTGAIADAADWGGCGIFDGKRVAANGWRNAWAPTA